MTIYVINQTTKVNKHTLLKKHHKISFKIGQKTDKFLLVCETVVRIASLDSHRSGRFKGCKSVYTCRALDSLFCVYFTQRIEWAAVP